MTTKKNRIAAVIEFGIHSPEAERMRYKRRKQRLALQGIDLAAMLKAKKKQLQAKRSKLKNAANSDSSANPR